MTTMKARLAALSMLDRALGALTDDELAAAVASLPDEHRQALDRLAAVPDGATDEDRVAALRTAAVRGRVNGGLEQIAAVVADPCLADCIEQLGEHADQPSLEQLTAALPGVTERHGVGLTRLMLASAVAGEAPASAAIVHLLKHDDVLKLPPAPAPAPAEPRPQRVEDPARAELRERRRARRQQEQAEARARREQSERDRHSR